jgi:hypothetical protein
MMTEFPRRIGQSRAFWGACALALLALSPSAQAQQGGSFDTLIGTWSGTGTVSLASGAKERIRCQAAYALGNDANNLRSALRCASDSYKFELNSDVNSRGGTLSGAWREVSRGLTGALSGTLKGADVQARIDSPGFGADLSLVTRGTRQTVTLSSQSTELTDVSITLTKQR